MSVTKMVGEGGVKSIGKREGEREKGNARK